jgi:LacI family transcriptional regulator
VRARRRSAGSRLGDVARAAGVSTATVSRVLNSTGAVSEEYRSKVLRAVDELDYYPNAHARTLASGRSSQIGLLISDIANPFFPELVKSIERAAFRHGFEVVLEQTDYDSERLARSVRRFLERSVAGVVIMASELTTSLIDGLARRRVPLVLLDLRTGWAGTSTVRVDYASGIDEAVRHLAGLGHRHLAFVSGPLAFASAAARFEAFRTAFGRYAHDGPPPLFLEADFRFEGGLRAAAELLASRPRPTAVLAANDWMAMGVLRACRTEGLRVPAELSVVGFDDIAVADLTDPPLSTVRLPREELGRRAVEVLMLSLGSHSKVPADIRVSTRFVPRGTTAPVPSVRSRSPGAGPPGAHGGTAEQPTRAPAEAKPGPRGG